MRIKQTLKSLWCVPIKFLSSTIARAAVTHGVACERRAPALSSMSDFMIPSYSARCTFLLKTGIRDS